MKKLLIGLCIIMMVSLAGCGEGLLENINEAAEEAIKKENLGNVENKEEQKEEEKVVETNNTETVDKKQAWRSGDYVLKYSYTMGTSTTGATITRTGNYYYNYGGEKSLLNYLWVKQEGSTDVKNYMLMPNSMKGSSSIQKNTDINKILSLGHEEMLKNPDDELVKIGEEKIIGRDTDKYYLKKSLPKFEKDGTDLVIENTTWVDKDIGVVLKKETKQNGEILTLFDVLEFRLETVDPATAIPDLSQYEITEN